MVDTPRTTSSLLTTLFQDGQAAASISPQDVRDFVVSGPQWDTLAGVASPNIIRGGLDGQKYFIAQGGAIGDMSGTPAQRATNGTALQATFNYSTTNSKWLELPPAVYEINNSAGIVCPFTGSGNFALRLRGSMMGTIISQFYTTTNGGPILTIGDPTGTTETQGLDIEGIAVRFGTSVSTKTAAVPIVLGFLTNSVVDNINIMGDSNPGFDAVEKMGVCFSNEMRNWRIWGWQRNGYYIGSGAGGSTGDHHSNWFMTPGGGPPSSYGAMTGNYINVDGHISDHLFTRLNTEWGATNAVFRAGWSFVCEGISFDEWHLEGIQMTGASPSILQLAGAMVRIRGMQLTTDTRAANLTGNAALVSDWMGGSSTILLDGLNMVQLLSPSQDVPFYLLQPYSLSSSATVLEMRSLRFDDAGTGQLKGRFQPDQHLAVTANAFVQKVLRYKFGIKGSIIESALIQVTGAYTHYGQYEDAVISLAATGTYTINLAATMGATGTQKPRTGNTVTIERATYTSGTVTIQNAGGALTTNASTTTLFFQFDGTNWVAFTAVT